MEQGPKEPRTVKVKRMFEPDRISAINLQAAYEQLLPTKQYRIVLGQCAAEKQDQERKAPERGMP